MRTLILYNASSGRGRGHATGTRFLQALRAAGHDADALAVRREPAFEHDLRAALRGVAVLAAVGGDGTVHHAAAAAMDAGAAVYHVPLGNENLFAREFGSDARPQTLLDALASPRFGSVDVGRLHTPGPDGTPGPARPFVLMASAGPDASVIHRLALARRRALGHLAYLTPIAAELLRPAFPTITVEVDGHPVVREARGLVVIANCRQYALRIDPARRASMTDGRLDAVFFPCRSRVQVLRWAARARAGRHLAAPGLVYSQGERITVRLHGGGPVQLDGEALTLPQTAPKTGDSLLRFTVDPRALRILLPAGPAPNVQTPNNLELADGGRCSKLGVGSGG